MRSVAKSWTRKDALRLHTSCALPETILRRGSGQDSGQAGGTGFKFSKGFDDTRLGSYLES